MLRLQAFRFELVPDGRQQRLMCCFAGACRFVFNKALALLKENHVAGKPFIGYVTMAKHLTTWRNDPKMPWLREAPCHPMQHALKHLDQAFRNFFAGRAAYPCFKRNGDQASFRYPDAKQFKLDQSNSRIFLPKLGWMRYRNSRHVAGELRNVTVSRVAGKWFVSIQARLEVEPCGPVGNSTVGIDVGIVHFATLNDGAHISPVNCFERHRKRLARYQRQMSRKVKFSRNWRKARTRVRKLHARIANMRRDFLHKASTAISKSYAIVCVEDLQVKNMTRSAKGTALQPGKMVRQKQGLNRSILDQGWGEFRRQLLYKLAWNGGILVAVPPHHTSQTCPDCGHVSPESRRTQARFQCVGCGYRNHADVVGAINILERGLRLLACGELAQSGHSVKQEPTEVTTQFTA